MDPNGPNWAQMCGAALKGYSPKYYCGGCYITIRSRWHPGRAASMTVKIRWASPLTMPQGAQKLHHLQYQ